MEGTTVDSNTNVVIETVSKSQALQEDTYLEAYMHYLWFWSSNSIIVKIFKDAFLET